MSSSVETKIVTYNGQSVKTKYITEVTDTEWQELKSQYYEKPDFESVKKQFKTIQNGGTKNDKITNYYFKDLMSKVKLWHSKWSIEELWECKELVELFKAKTLDNKKLFPDTMPLIKKMIKAIELGGKAYASKPTNFPLKTVDYVLENYNVNNNWCDFSCGWGVRLTGALKHNVNYFGTDPNFVLVDRLNKLARDYRSVIDGSSTVDIRITGSEVYNEDWKNKMGLAFSSPPYFSLEDYKIGKQSYTEDTTYEDWKNNYLRQTINNIYYYLIQEGYFLLNINNFDKFDLVGDSIAIAEEIGFELVKIDSLENNNRCKRDGFMDSNEGILVFVKS